MTTVINTPGSNNEGGDSALGIIVGVLIALVLVVLFVIYILPNLRSDGTPAQQQQPSNINIDVKLPADNTPAQAPVPAK